MPRRQAGRVNIADLERATVSDAHLPFGYRLVLADLPESLRTETGILPSTPAETAKRVLDLLAAEKKSIKINKKRPNEEDYPPSKRAKANTVTTSPPVHPATASLRRFRPVRILAHIHN